MIDTTIFLERFLQQYRFRMVRPYLMGDVLDFGGNEGELEPLIEGEYLVVNYDHSVMDGKRFDTIASLAVIEHIEVDEVFSIFRRFKQTLRPGGRIFLTTPTRAARPILEALAFLRILDPDNIAEHKHYWTRREIEQLATETGFHVRRYRKFQLGVNQLAVLEHAAAGGEGEGSTARGGRERA